MNSISFLWIIIHSVSKNKKSHSSQTQLHKRLSNSLPPSDTLNLHPNVQVPLKENHGLASDYYKEGK